MAQTNETAKATVYLDGKQAETALGALSKEAENFQKQMKQALAEGDMKKFQTAEKNLKSTQKAMGGLRKEMFSVDKVMKNLSGSTLTDLEKALQKTRSEMRRMSRTDTKWDEKRKQAQLLKKEITNVRTEMGRMQSPGQKVLNTVKGWLPAFGAAAIIGGLKAIGAELFSLTKQMQGDAVRSATVFGNQLGYVEQEAAKVAKQMGLTNREFVANAAATADLLIPLEFTREESAKMSVELQRLTGALDEWTGGSLGAAEVSNILTKAMLGENEQLKQLGIAIRKDSDEFRELVKVKMEAGNVTKAQAEAMATLELITQKSADAQAAYNQEGNKLLRLQKSISVQWKEMKESAVKYFDELLNSMDAEDRMDSFTENLQTQQRVMNTLFETIKDTTVSEKARKEAIDKLNAEYRDYIPFLITEKTTLTEITTAQEHANKALLANLALKRKTADIDAIMNESLTKQQELSKQLMGAVDKKSPGLGGVFYQEYLDLIDEAIARGDAYNQETQRSIGDLARKYRVSFMDIFDVSKETFEIRAEEAQQIQQLTSFYDAYIEKYKELIKVGTGGEDDDKPDKDPDEIGVLPPDDFEDELPSDISFMTEEEELAFARRKEVWEDWVQFQMDQYAQMDQTTQEYWQTQQAIADAEEDLRQRTMGTLLDLSNTMAVIAGENSAAAKAAFATERAFAIAQVWQNLPKERSGIVTSASLLPPGAREAYIAKSMTMAQIRAGLNTAAIAATTIKGISGSKREGGYAETGPNDDEPKGIYHANEFWVTAEGVRNPQVKEVLDIIDVAQKNGTISTIDLPRAITGQLPGKQQGGYTSEEATPAPVYNMPSPEAIAAAMANELRRNPLKGVWEWREYTEGKKEMEDIEEDAGF